MKKIEILLKQYDKAIQKALYIKSNIEKLVVFDDFDDEKPDVTITQDGIVAEWKGRILTMEDVTMIMNGRGYIEPNDFDLFGY